MKTRTLLLLIVFTILCAQAQEGSVGDRSLAVGGPPASTLATDFLPQGNEGAVIATVFFSLVAIAVGALVMRRLLRGDDRVRVHEPLVHEEAPEFIRRREFDDLREWVKSHDTNIADMERRFEAKLDVKFNQLNTERRANIAVLHEKVDENDHRNQARFEQLLEKIAELRGKMEGRK